jgi:hypothetical protein
MTTRRASRIVNIIKPGALQPAQPATGVAKACHDGAQADHEQPEAIPQHPGLTTRQRQEPQAADRHDDAKAQRQRRGLGDPAIDDQVQRPEQKVGGQSQPSADAAAPGDALLAVFVEGRFLGGLDRQVIARGGPQLFDRLFGGRGTPLLHKAHDRQARYLRGNRDGSQAVLVADWTLG